MFFSFRENIISINITILQVAWLRVDTQTILTIQNHVITKNHRIGVSNSDRSRIIVGVGFVTTHCNNKFEVYYENGVRIRVRK